MGNILNLKRCAYIKEIEIKGILILLFYLFRFYSHLFFLNLHRDNRDNRDNRDRRNDHSSPQKSQSQQPTQPTIRYLFVFANFMPAHLFFFYLLPCLYLIYLKFGFLKWFSDWNFYILFTFLLTLILFKWTTSRQSLIFALLNFLSLINFLI